MPATRFGLTGVSPGTGAFRRIADDLERRGCLPGQVAPAHYTADKYEIAALERMRGEPLTSAEYGDLARARVKKRLEEIDRD